MVYILECSDGTLYTGQTNDIDRRVEEHNAGKYCRYTFPRRPVKVVFRHEVESRGEALRMEMRIKKLTRSQKLRIVQGDIGILERVLP